MWSAGCVLGEMLTGKVVFKADDTVRQIKRMVRLIGLPENEQFSRIKDPLIRKYIV